MMEMTKNMEMIMIMVMVVIITKMMVTITMVTRIVVLVVVSPGFVAQGLEISFVSWLRLPLETRLCWSDLLLTEHEQV